MSKKFDLVSYYSIDLDNRIIEFEEKWDELRLLICSSEIPKDDKHKMLDLSYDLMLLLYDLEDIEI